jgi:hypothetical protein
MAPVSDGDSGEKGWLHWSDYGVQRFAEVIARGQNRVMGVSDIWC